MWQEFESKLFDAIWHEAQFVVVVVVAFARLVYQNAMLVVMSQVKTQIELVEADGVDAIRAHVHNQLAWLVQVEHDGRELHLAFDERNHFAHMCRYHFETGLVCQVLATLRFAQFDLPSVQRLVY